jgi:hypothetical protein
MHACTSVRCVHHKKTKHTLPSCLHANKHTHTHTRTSAVCTCNTKPIPPCPAAYILTSACNNTHIHTHTHTHTYTRAVCTCGTNPNSPCPAACTRTNLSLPCLQTVRPPDLVDSTVAVSLALCILLHLSPRQCPRQNRLRACLLLRARFLRCEMCNVNIYIWFLLVVCVCFNKVPSVHAYSCLCTSFVWIHTTHRTGTLLHTPTYPIPTELCCFAWIAYSHIHAHTHQRFCTLLRIPFRWNSGAFYSSRVHTHTHTHLHTHTHINAPAHSYVSHADRVMLLSIPHVFSHTHTYFYSSRIFTQTDRQTDRHRHKNEPADSSSSHSDGVRVVLVLSVRSRETCAASTCLVF